MFTLVQDVRFAFRMFVKSPAFSAVVVLSLALGIGVNTAIFSLVDAVLLEMLPVRDPHQLVLLTDPDSSGVSIGSQTGVRALLSYSEFSQLRGQTEVFSGLLAAQSRSQRLSLGLGGTDDATEPAQCKLVSGEYFRVLGVQAILGRVLEAEDDRGPGTGPVAVMSFGYWSRRFGRDPAVLGRPIRVHQTMFSVVGVAPPRFFGETVGDSPDLWMPLTMQPQVMPGRDFLSNREYSLEKVMWLHVMGRLKPGIGLEQAQVAVDASFRQQLQAQDSPRLTADERRDLMDQRLVLSPGSRGASPLRKNAAAPLLLLMALVTLVLFVTCANVANLLLARATNRQREIGVRLALGAGRGRLVRQLMTESIVLGLAGGAVGLLFARWGQELLVSLITAEGVPLPPDLAPDARVLGFTALASLLTGIVFGLAPALRAGKLDLNSSLKEGARGSTGSARPRFGMPLGKILVVAQVAMALLMLVGAGLFVRSLQQLAAVTLGYDSEHLLLLRVDPIPAGYKGAAALVVQQQLLDRIAAVPGVRAVSLSENGLFSGTESQDPISIAGHRSGSDEAMEARWDQVGPNYFSTVGIPVLLGREIGPQDAGNAPPVGVINETMARAYFGSENPVGKIVTDEYPGNHFSFQVVGVMKDAKYNSLREETPRRFYIPYFRALAEVGAVVLEVRTLASPGAVAAAVRHEIQAVDTNLQITSVKTMEDLVNRSTAQDRLLASLSSFFGVLALLLACLGLYGIMSYSIGRRANEIGIRMALGAQNLTVLWMVLRETFVLVALGLAIGLPAAFAAARLISSQLFGLGPVDAVATAGATLLLLAVAGIAGFLPARRATRVDPMVALRYE
jgi:putative ABC transport system permease protein